MAKRLSYYEKQRTQSENSNITQHHYVTNITTFHHPLERVIY